MSNESEVKDAEVIDVAPVEAEKVEVAASAIIQGSVTIELRGDGALSVNAPGNVLLALAIIKAGEVYLTMQMQDQFRKASQRAAIVPANSDMLNMMKKLSRPS